MLQHDRGSDLLGAHLASDFAPGVHCAGKNIFATANSQKIFASPEKYMHLTGGAAGVAGGGGRGGGGGLLQVPQKVGGVQGLTNQILTQHFI